MLKFSDAGAIRRRGILLPVIMLVAACGPTDGTVTPPGSSASPGSPPSGVSPSNGTPVSANVTYAPLPPVPTVQKPGVGMIHLKIVPAAGGATMADLDRDNDANDDFKPELDVVFSADDYPAPADGKPNAKLKVRGQSSRESGQKSYAVTIADEQPGWQGSHDVLLNKHPYELTRLRNKLSFDLFAGLKELPALETSFARLDIDGKDYGFFTRIEKADKGFLRRTVPGSTGEGPFYKAQQFEFFADSALKLTSDPGYDKKAFERVLEIEGDKNHAPLLEMLAAVNDDARPFDQVFAKYFDQANYITWFAVNVLTWNLDTNSQNFYLYNQPGKSTWTFIPWDYDDGWGFYEQPNEAANKPPLWSEGVDNWWNVKLHRRFISNAADLAALGRRVDELADNYFTPARIQAYLDAYKPVVKEQIAKEPDFSQLPTTGGDKLAEWESEVARMPAVIAQRKAVFHQTLERPMPVYVSQPEKGDEGWNFTWDASVDLQGDALTYDLQLARTPGFAASDVVLSKAGLTEPMYVATEPLAPGKYFLKVTVRDAKGNTQSAFESYEDASGHRYNGIREVAIE